MEYGFVTLKHKDEWRVWLARAGGGDIYHGAPYHALYEDHIVVSKAMAFFCRQGEAVLFHPFFLRPIENVGEQMLEGAYYDIEGSYGYAGPLAKNATDDFLNQAWDVYDDWCRENNVISEFVRFNNTFETENFAPADMEVIDSQQVVIVDLKDENSLWKNYQIRQRNSVRKALKEGLEVEIVGIKEGLRVFREIYELTMRLHQAKPFYFFNDNYYQDIIDSLPNRAFIAQVRKDGEIIASSLFLHANGRIHYHLSGSRPEARKSSPNNLLLHKVALWAIEKGFNEFHLGGGTTTAPDDSLLRFKKSFSPLRKTFKIGKRILNQKRFNEFNEVWKGQFPNAPRQPYFQVYRLSQPIVL